VWGLNIERSDLGKTGLVSQRVAYVTQKKVYSQLSDSQITKLEHTQSSESDSQGCIVLEFKVVEGSQHQGLHSQQVCDKEFYCKRFKSAAWLQPML
uniref:Vitellogenin n=1 Tax=Romanomermis culicivorax TaxID=13658 RepID=A0A915KRH6_ROMCU